MSVFKQSCSLQLSGLELLGSLIVSSEKASHHTGVFSFSASPLIIDETEESRISEIQENQVSSL